MEDGQARLSEALRDRYRLERELGRGGMATVYLARDLRHDRPVALKVFRSELSASMGTERFLREIRLTARLDHPHILPLLDSGTAGGALFYAMPYVEGESLRERLEREKQLPLEDVLRIVRQVTDALDHAHRQGIVHRDIKPENILLGTGHARLADFGIARAVDAAGGETLTGAGLGIGTPTYMSPEQASGDREVDARADVYSLACVVYEMLAGQPPHTGATVEAIHARKALEQPPALRIVRPALPAGVDAAIRKALAPAPADRWQSVGELLAALEHPTRAAWTRRAGPRTILIATGLFLTFAAAWWWIARGPAVVRVESLAVLPFTNLSGDPEQEYFADGMTEELIARLAGIGGLSVRSRTSVMRYRNSGEPLPRIAGVLGVDALIEGSVSRSEHRVRIRAQLVQARPERTLWSGTYDRDLRDLLTLQSEVARHIADEVGAAVTPEEERRLVRTSGTDPVATEAYFKGRFFWNRRTAEDLRRAVRHFEQAIALDSGFARAHAGLAGCYVLLSQGRISVLRPDEALPMARAAANRALALQDDLAEAHTALAYVETYEWNWEAAERHFQRALALDPGDGTTHFWYAAALAAQGRIDEAVARAREGQRLEPLSPIIAAGVAWMLHLARRHEDAVSEAQQVLLLEPGFAIGHFRLGVTYGWLDRYDEAIRELTLAYQASGDNPTYLASLAQMYARSGREQEARRRLGDVLDLARRQYVPAYSIAAIHVALGEVDQAFVWLDRAVEERSAEVTFLGVEPEMDVLRSDPRFREVLRRLGLSDRGGSSP